MAIDDEQDKENIEDGVPEQGEKTPGISENGENGAEEIFHGLLGSLEVEGLAILPVNCMHCSEGLQPVPVHEFRIFSSRMAGGGKGS